MLTTTSTAVSVSSGTDFYFNSLLGKVYTTENEDDTNNKNRICFTLDGQKLLSPVGNRITSVDFASNSSKTSFYGHKYNIQSFCLLHNNRAVCTVSQDGTLTLLSYPKGIILSKFDKFLEPRVDSVVPSPNGDLVCFLGSKCSIYKFQSAVMNNQDNSMLHQTSSRPIKLGDVKEAVCHTCADWIDSKFIAVGTNDGIVHVYKLDLEQSGVEMVDLFSNHHILSGNKDEIVGCFFVFNKQHRKKNPGQIYSLDAKGCFLHWSFNSAKKQWQIIKKVDLTSKTDASKKNKQNRGDGKMRIKCCSYHPTSNLLVYGIGHAGCFEIYDIENDQIIYRLGKPHNIDGIQFLTSSSTIEQMVKNNQSTPSITVREEDEDTDIKTDITLPNSTWIAFSKENQLAVFDYESETFIYNQSNHSSQITTSCYNENGQLLASGDYQGTIKVYSTENNQCFCNLPNAHSGPITGMIFSRPPGSRDAALYTSSLDGTVRAFDVLRYKQFRMFTSVDAEGFSCLTVDPSGEIVIASGSTSYNIYMWNVQTNQLLEVIKSHTAPVTRLQFTIANESTLISSSWDKSCKLWNIFGSKQAAEPIEFSSEILDVAVRPTDGAELAAVVMNGEVQFFDILNVKSLGYIDCKRDIQTLFTNPNGDYFSCISYTGDGQHVLCGGKFQPFVCMYNVKQKVLIKRFIVSFNMSLEGMFDMDLLNPLIKKIRDDRKDTRKSGNKSKKIGEQTIPGNQLELKPNIQVDRICVSPTNSEFSIVSPNEGILIFSNASKEGSFQPLDIDPSITPESIMKLLEEESYTEAFINSIRLNEPSILVKVFNAIPVDSVPLIVRSIPDNYLDRFLQFLSRETNDSTRIQFCMVWLKSVLAQRKLTGTSHGANFRSLVRVLQQKMATLSYLTQQNQNTLNYLASFTKPKRNIIEEEKERKKNLPKEEPKSEETPEEQKLKSMIKSKK
ncbi:hypothetical protein NAEGRDRAFT_80729 [Naegleria gruberi]|uniref:Small-subunit processome Utp12 domain-containing protein n=1 Tax=Naegleria gruberi TaxID=5762 RepID=D2VPA1_NAEGR|nr:uncharacterized protein NAEGRDRAFT_80729 [Naegleria gruberi]EFC41395.1 hypothetical protein NAEGRDRAFT_80729 [Naegleria gruberi]|eukprot:XP_002674139.1 hypothetical protein NAEGRDRAFT_80729 [Naegleria gruberi strain NEG-M]